MDDVSVPDGVKDDEAPFVIDAVAVVVPEGVLLHTPRADCSVRSAARWHAAGVYSQLPTAPEKSYQAGVSSPAPVVNRDGNQCQLGPSRHTSPLALTMPTDAIPLLSDDATTVTPAHAFPSVSCTDMTAQCVMTARSAFQYPLACATSCLSRPHALPATHSLCVCARRCCPTACAVAADGSMGGDTASHTPVEALNSHHPFSSASSVPPIMSSPGKVVSLSVTVTGMTRG